MASKYASLKNKIIFQKYKLLKIIGFGSFGCVFQGINQQTKKPVAIKVESNKSESNLLQMEFTFLSLLKGYGIPELISYGRYGNFRVMVQQILGFNLMHIKSIIKKFTIKDIAMMGIQMMDRMEFIHSKNVIHRDIKPENFVTGYDDISTLYLIDFGISRKYRSSRTGKHVKFDLTGRMFGTVRYASYNASRGVEQSRRDDLESIGNMLIYMYTGKLPWKGISVNDRERKKKYLEMLLLKKYTSNETVCKNMPKEFLNYYKYCKNLKFEEDPDYEYLRNVFRSILISKQEIYDYKFSWITNRDYIKKLKNYGGKINTKVIIIKKNTKKTRSKSPGYKLYYKIKNTMEKENEKYKNSIGHSENMEPQNNKFMSNIELDSYNIHNRGISEDVVRLPRKNDISENQNNLTKSKMDFTYKSNIAQYNMNVDDFQDENKIYEQNKDVINKIKNSKDENININLMDLHSYNSERDKKKKNGFNISEENKGFGMNNISKKNKNKISSSDDIIKNFLFNINNKEEKIDDYKNNKNLKKTLSEKKENNNALKEFFSNYKIKNGFIKLYKFFQRKLNYYLNIVFKRRPYPKNQKKVKQKVIVSYNPKNKVIKKENIMKNENSPQNFSFKNVNIDQNIQNITKKLNFPNTKQINIMKNRLTEPYQNNKINVANEIYTKTKININRNVRKPKDNIKRSKIISKNNYLDNNGGINIIINANLSRMYSTQKKDKKNNNNNINIFNKNKSGIPSQKQSNLNSDNSKLNKILLNKPRPKDNNNHINNFLLKDKINNNNNNYNKEIQNKINRILIPNGINARNFNKNRNNFSILYNSSSSKFHSINSNLIPNSEHISHNIKLNNDEEMPSNKSFRTFNYRSIFTRKNYSPNQYITQNKGNQISSYETNLQRINLNQLRFKHMKKNNSYDSIKNKLISQNKIPFNIITNLGQIPINNKSSNNNNNINYLKQRNDNIQLKNNNNKIMTRHYSPDNNINKNRNTNIYLFGNKEFIKKIRNKRSNSDPNVKKIVNYNRINVAGFENMNYSYHMPKNINNLNSNNYNPTSPKCINKIKI